MKSSASPVLKNLREQACKPAGLRRRSIARAILGLIAAVILLPSSRAALITGSIDFTGGAVLNSSLQTATGYGSFYGTPGPSPAVLGGSQTGDYGSVPTGTAVAINPFLFKPYDPSSAVSIPLWSFMVGTTEYSFSATSIPFVQQLPGYLNVQGEGVASITGYSDTAATWSFTDTGFGPGTSFNFGGSMTAIPEASLMPLVTALALAVFALLDSRRGGLVEPTAR